MLAETGPKATTRTEAARTVPRTVVVTGGSAGVGRAVALACADRGDRVALIARSRSGLEDAAGEVRARGGSASLHPLDVADHDALAQAAIEIERRFGPIDVWVNAAMVTVFAPVADLTPAELKRVMEVTFLGNAHGLMLALRHMRSRDRGTIVQVGSALAYRGIPLQAAYCAAKHALKGFCDSMQAELLRDRSGVKLTTVHLPAVNTPQFEWARTHQGRQPRPVAPVFLPEAVADVILDAIDNPRREVWVGRPTLVTILGAFAAPRLADRYLAATAVRGQQSRQQVAPDRADNLFQPVEGLHRTHGRFDRESRDRVAAVGGTALRLALAGGAATLLAGLTVGGALLSRATAGPGRLPRR